MRDDFGLSPVRCRCLRHSRTSKVFGVRASDPSEGVCEGAVGYELSVAMVAGLHIDQ